ncbi:uncharacterized protein LOC123307900 [Coccinella septempunctata]|uniref:uncharacterized protein LOC123307900 n=1 Tax=Coccinella septempunctata TaxID=41139 RepID=UPI001D05D927|nr:uncharacterized protein LOC123307900 [Coccinella septempunctata]
MLKIIKIDSEELQFKGTHFRFLEVRKEGMYFLQAQLFEGKTKKWLESTYRHEPGKKDDYRFRHEVTMEFMDVSHQKITQQVGTRRSEVTLIQMLLWGSTPRHKTLKSKLITYSKDHIFPICRKSQAFLRLCIKEHIQNRIVSSDDAIRALYENGLQAKRKARNSDKKTQS